MIVDPRLAEQPPQFRPPEYEEDGSARTTRMYLGALMIPGLLCVGIVASAVLGSVGVAAILAVLLLFFAFLSSTILSTRLPLGIRMDAQGIRIGGVRGNRVHRDKPIQGFTRAMHVYSCDWQGVRRIKVLTEPRELALMARRFGGPQDLNPPWWAFLSLAPWAPGRFIDNRSAALVIEVETARASFQATRPPKITALVDSIYNSPTMTWVIPTRDPQRLKAALAAALPPIPED